MLVSYRSSRQSALCKYAYSFENGDKIENGDRISRNSAYPYGIDARGRSGIGRKQ
jgi:hypothetical protein